MLEFLSKISISGPVPKYKVFVVMFICSYKIRLRLGTLTGKETNNNKGEGHQTRGKSVTSEQFCGVFIINAIICRFPICILCFRSMDLVHKTNKDNP